MKQLLLSTIVIFLSMGTLVACSEHDPEELLKTSKKVASDVTAAHQETNEAINRIIEKTESSTQNASAPLNASGYE